MSAPLVAIENLTVGYEAQAVVGDFNLTIGQGQFVSLLGPSGCGKTTILRTVAGFLPALSGRILLGGHDVTALPPERRDVGIVFQNYALFPTMNAFENIAFGLRVARVPGREINARVKSIAEASGILEHLEKKPAELSGGQQQRVAIARALVMGPGVLLFDEPLSNLDAKVRVAMRCEIKRLQREIGFTALFVTHDQEEALSMSDVVVVLNGGHVEQTGAPRDLYSQPASPFVAQFIGSANELSPALAARLVPGATGRCFVRYEDLLIAAEGVPAMVSHVEFLGPVSRIDCEAEGQTVSLVQFGTTLPEVGDTIGLAVRPGSHHLFPEATP